MNKKITPNEAVNLLKSNELVIMPTETVYGLAANAYSHEAVKKVFDVKRRPYTKALIVHYASILDMNKDLIITESAYKLANIFWPGPLTLVLSRRLSSQISSIVSANLYSVAVRIPAHIVTLDTINKLGFPLAMPSANKYQSISPTNAANAAKFLNTIPVVDGGYSKHGVESTIVDCRGNNINILRHGAISKEKIEQALNMNVGYVKKNSHPGSDDRHYGVKKKIRLNAKEVRRGEGLLSFGKHGLFLPSGTVEYNLSETSNLQDAARKLFYLLNKLDESNCTSIAVMEIPNEDIGVTINDRLTKAACEVFDN